MTDTETYDFRDDALERAIAAYRDVHLRPAPEPSEAMVAFLSTPRTPAAPPRGPRLRVHTADARPWLRSTDQTFDVIMVDSYRQPYIPFYLATREFFDEVRDHLAPGGLVVINVGHPEQSDALEKVLSATMRAVFGGEFVWRDPAEPTNTMLVGSTATDPAGRLRAAAVPLPSELGEVARATADRPPAAPEAIDRFIAAERELLQALGRSPTPEELATELDPFGP